MAGRPPARPHRGRLADLTRTRLRNVRLPAVGLTDEVVVWLNGAFGVGKTSVARELTGLLPEARLVDPERLGFVMRRTLWRGRDYQDVPLWRDLTRRHVDLIGRRRTAVVPMTVTDPAVLAQLAGGAEVFLLTAHRTTIESRIASSGEAVDWRSGQLDRCLDAFERGGLGHPIPTDGLTPSQVAVQIASALADTPRTDCS